MEPDDEDIKLLYLSSNMVKILSGVKEKSGFIAGLATEGAVYCLSACSTTDFFLSGLSVIGFFCRINSDVDVTDESALLDIATDTNLTSEIPTDSIVVLFIHNATNDDGESNITAKLLSPFSGNLDDLPWSTKDQNPVVLLRASGSVPLVLEVSSDIDIFKENIEIAMERLKTTFQGEMSAFQLCNSNFILHPFQYTKCDPGTICKNLVHLSQTSDIPEKSKASKKHKEKQALNFKMLLQVTGTAALENTLSHSVIIHCQRRSFQCTSLSLPVDVLAIALENSSLREMYKILKESVQKQLFLMCKDLINYAKASEITAVKPYHFYPEIWDVPITLLYPLDCTDSALENVRRSLHEKLYLPLDKPFLKKLNSSDFSNSCSLPYLINPHEGLNTARITGGKIAVVHGRYSYHHYMQDHMNDDGWGCAYRSLQTIVSWFKFQGYTDRSIPTHKEIQQALVDVGDKPEAFVGSRKWIGSQEVSFCLDHLIKVQSKIMFVSSGSEMESKGRELFNHFVDQGTPIMIGGGVLAHTILGVDFNQNTGELKFLILDPHYTGGEEINVILNKGWCGWKTMKFWDQNAFYNLCLPQRPLQI